MIVFVIIVMIEITGQREIVFIEFHEIHSADSPTFRKIKRGGEREKEREGEREKWGKTKEKRENKEREREREKCKEKQIQKKRES